MSIASDALELIRDPARHTTKAAAIDKEGNNCPSAVPTAVAWSVYGAVNRVGVLNPENLPLAERLGPWRDTIRALRALGAKHSTSHEEAVRMLESL